MFEKAARLKLRFDTSKGPLSVEELWDLPLISDTSKINLDDVARGLNNKLKSENNVSFVLKENKSDEITQLKFDIVRRIIEVRLLEEAAAKKARENKIQKQKLLQLIAEKQDESLKGKTIEELMKMIGELE